MKFLLEWFRKTLQTGQLRCERCGMTFELMSDYQEHVHCYTEPVTPTVPATVIVSDTVTGETLFKKSVTLKKHGLGRFCTDELEELHLQTNHQIEINWEVYFPSPIGLRIIPMVVPQYGNSPDVRTITVKWPEDQVTINNSYGGEGEVFRI